MTSPDAPGAALPDPTHDPAKKISADAIGAHYDTRLPDLPWSRRIQIPIIAAAVYSVIRHSRPHVALRGSLAGKTPNAFTRTASAASGHSGTASSSRLSGGIAITASWTT